MSKWPLRKLGDDEICILNPKKAEVAGLANDTPVSFVPMARVDEISGTMNVSESKNLGDVRKGYTYFAEGDVVFAKITPCMENGKSAIARNLINGVGFGTTEFHVLRPRNLVTSEWLRLFVRDKNFREQAKKNMHGAAGQQRVPVDFLRDSQIPVPPIHEQHRIVQRIEDLTRRMEEVRKLRQNTTAEMKSLFFHKSRKIYTSLLSEFPEKSLGKCGRILGGGTPSKQRPDFWDGEIPWVSAKDMKVFFLSDSGLKITNKGLAGSTAKLIPAHSVLFVVRGSILYRYVPVAVNLMPCTINQDLKAIVPGRDINPVFLAHMLQAANDILKGMVEEAANTAGKLPTKSWSELRIPVPETGKQESVVRELTALQEKLTELDFMQTEASKEFENFQSALFAKAFRGEL